MVNGGPTCVNIGTVGGPMLLRNAEYPGMALDMIFTGPDPGCGPAQDPALGLDPFGPDCTPDLFPAMGDDDAHVQPFNSGDRDPETNALDPAAGTVFFYQVDNNPSVGMSLMVTKQDDGGEWIINIHYQ